MAVVMSRNAIVVRSGTYLDYSFVSSQAISLEDIAWSLAHTCRFCGHTNSFYSVAQHCVLVSSICPDGLMLEGLMHDAAEAYIGDVPGPLKRLLKGTSLEYIERNIETQIANKFKLMYPWPAPVKDADLIMLRTEKANLFPKIDPSDDWGIPPGPMLPEPMEPWGIEESYTKWMDQYNKFKRVQTI